jgi:hypothetical protein
MLTAHDGSASIWGIPVKIAVDADTTNCVDPDRACQVAARQGRQFMVTRLEVGEFFKVQGSALSAFVTFVAVVSAFAIQVGAITQTASKAPSKTTVRATR